MKTEQLINNWASGRVRVVRFEPRPFLVFGKKFRVVYLSDGSRICVEGG